MIFVMLLGITCPRWTAADRSLAFLLAFALAPSIIPHAHSAWAPETVRGDGHGRHVHSMASAELGSRRVGAIAQITTATDCDQCPVPDCGPLVQCAGSTLALASRTPVSPNVPTRSGLRRGMPRTTRSTSPQPPTPPPQERA